MRCLRDSWWCLSSQVPCGGAGLQYVGMQSGSFAASCLSGLIHFAFRDLHPETLSLKAHVRTAGVQGPALRQSTASSVYLPAFSFACQKGSMSQTVRTRARTYSEVINSAISAPQQAPTRGEASLAWILRVCRWNGKRGKCRPVFYIP